MSVNLKKKMIPGKNRSFLAKDFESLRGQLIENARIFFEDSIQDFSESSVAGLLVDMAASVGDTMSFYLDHQFRELDPTQAVEIENINTHLTNAGVKIVGAAPASVYVDLSFIVDAELSLTDNTYYPKENNLPYVFSNTIFEGNGVTFNLLEDVNFAEKDANNRYIATYEVSARNGSGLPLKFKVTRKCLATSGTETLEEFSIPDTHIPFREITMSNNDVSEILSVYDEEGNSYYEVESLSHDTVFKAVDNDDTSDSDIVPKTLEILPAPYRFVKLTSPIDFKTTIRFGSGASTFLSDNVLDDPSDLALSLYGKSSMSRFSLDPNLIINTSTLGISPRNTTIYVNYRHGGGLRHNVSPESITSINTLSLEFRKKITPADALAVRKSALVTNKKSAAGGSNAPDIEFLRSLISSSRNSQSRIVTRKDLIARIYTLPSQFGRVFRVGLSENKTRGNSLKLYLISLNREGKLDIAPDNLKLNLSKYLNEMRLLSDSIDVLDAKVLNYKVKYEAHIERSQNKVSTITNINNKIAEALNIKYFQIDQPIIIDDILNIILNTPGVITVVNLELIPIVAETSSNELFSTNDSNRTYSTNTFSYAGSTKNGILRGPPGSIFELRYPEYDITGYAV